MVGLEPGDPKGGPNGFPVYVDIVLWLLLPIAAVSAAADAAVV